MELKYKVPHNRTVKKTLPTGEKFLPHTSMKELEKLYKKETDPKARDRLLAYMARKRREPLQKIGKSLRRPHSTIRNWILRATDGLDGLHDVRRPGPARRLSDGQLAELKEDLIAGPQAHGLGSHTWTGKMVAGHVRKKYGVSYVPRTMQELMHEMGLVHARPRHPKAAKGEEKKALERKPAR